MHGLSLERELILLLPPVPLIPLLTFTQSVTLSSFLMVMLITLRILLLLQLRLLTMIRIIIIIIMKL